ncbi:leupaxin isoform X2 [Rhinatrema bivittatum]|uniref:leupaxin isoform X2 n=1 Tax=Rhinatrema bivittatum TaxID=194408 RepID=UPI00112DC61E|nr:leupaxin isoform X2 [Rhinatrema bivittatum]
MDDLDVLLAELEHLSAVGSSREMPSHAQSFDLPAQPVTQENCQVMSGQAERQPSPKSTLPSPATEEEGVRGKVQPVYITHLQEDKRNVYSEVPENQSPSQSSPPPSSAVQQIDALMAQLFNMQAKLPVSKDLPQQSVVPLSPSSTLENMLGDLEQDMKSLGAAATPKGYCANCGKIIAGKKVLTAMDRTWHPEHFFCAHCGQVFDEEGFYERNGKPFCQKDFINIFSPRCAGCDQPLLNNYFSALNAFWHPECFVCGDCSCTFSQCSFFELNGRPYCELDYHRRQGSICCGCQKPITGRCVSAMGRRFHPEHFVCAFCLKQLTQGIFREQSDKPYCHACYSQLFV